MSYFPLMRNNVILLVVLVLLYLVPSLILDGVYGPSYGWLEGEDSWVPNNQGGWVKHGEPDKPMPSEPSVEVPVMVRYIPIFLPGAVLFLFLFTPLSKKLQNKPPDKFPEPGEPLYTEVEEVPPEETENPDKPDKT